MNSLVEALGAQSTELAARTIADMYRSPFWGERFGERGRSYALRDGQYHVEHLAQALLVDDPSVVCGYARWLQALLASRGMCTLHIVEHFEKLAGGIHATVPESARALEFLALATAALEHTDEAARALQRAADKVSTTAASRLEGFDEAWAFTSSARGGAAHREVARLVVSYLADAVAYGRAKLFTAHVGWMTTMLDRRRFARDPLRLLLRGIDDAVLEHVAPESQPPARRVVVEALVVVDRR